MKSIRLSLIVYFMALIAVALGGVSALAYRTTSTTLQDKQASTEDLIRAQFKAQAQDVRTALDRRISHQAQLLARKAYSRLMPREVLTLSFMAGAAATPANAISSTIIAVPTFMPLGSDPLANFVNFTHLGRTRPMYDIQIPPAAVDFYMPADEERPLEVFQTYRRNGMPVQWSPILEGELLTLSEEFRDRARELDEEFDDVDIDGQNFRRVTLKTGVAFPLFFGPNRAPSFGGNYPKNKGTQPKKGQQPGQGKNAAVTKMQPASKGQPSPGAQLTLFIQYAADTAQVEDYIAILEARRDDRLARLHQDTQTSLADMRRQLFWIASLTFLAVFTGGFMLVRLGLAPLARLSDAVSKVSEKNFQLQVNARTLPTELKPIAERLQQSLEQLRKAFDYEKQASADISHELRTPLAALMTTLDVALRKPRSPEEYREMLDECRLSGQHMTHLVERLMALARLDAGVDRPMLEPVDVAELAQQCADMIRPIAEEQGLALHKQLDESIVTVTDAGKLREILLNLLHNAIAYNKPSGSIDVTAARDNGHVVLAVRDTGIGIAREAQAHLFERFFRADPSRHTDTPHCGLGLAIVKSYVELLGGTIRVDSSPEGTTFEIRIPARDPDVSSEADDEALMQTVAD